MNWTEMFFQDWQGLVRTFVVGVLAYGTIVLFLRISGKRTLAKLNAFDLVVTVALGSTSQPFCYRSPLHWLRVPWL